MIAITPKEKTKSSSEENNKALFTRAMKQI
jgi:hypothetical protein